MATCAQHGVLEEHSPSSASLLLDELPHPPEIKHTNSVRISAMPHKSQPTANNSTTTLQHKQTPSTTNKTMANTMGAPLRRIAKETNLRDIARIADEQNEETTGAAGDGGSVASTVVHHRTWVERVKMLLGRFLCVKG
ncbi:hypothetical protein LTR10_020103 [Elasticomyces elasticus]|uniref:Uncharacterized protein n=1 Tax=Exophiala sideris TaxID=1016849 RepID=A0ABR0IX78_9EURO|nr:hypothetical protein LTR10_020103 [Elasticomyces elasticus]KAK5021565.1 hypothetical protein LTS07_010862 [Exophiala sideris]KAK5024803.1 hypothetical protein LTR13_010772 [Exophiala sideris]KAK5049702.1 hypothetical protein LTR69_010886 [Exophiala sideris]KAK5176683.1 hypothetical protein LTR44_010753 [Eurotiomycetes sp. CCFEE 6388]